MDRDQQPDRDFDRYWATDENWADPGVPGGSTWRRWYSAGSTPTNAVRRPATDEHSPTTWPNREIYWKGEVAAISTRLREPYRELSSALLERVRQITQELVEGDTDQVQTEVLARARGLVKSFTRNEGSLADTLVDLLHDQPFQKKDELLADLHDRSPAELMSRLCIEEISKRRPDREAELLAALRAGRHAVILAERQAYQITTRLTEYHAQRRAGAEKRARQAARRRRTIKRPHNTTDRARPLTLEEARQAVDLKMMSGSTDWELRKRVLIVLASAGGQSVDEIAETYTETTEYVREVIHAFNKQGLAALPRL